MKDGWYIYKNEQQLGPYSWEELWSESKTGKLTSEDLVWHAGMENWVRAEQVSGLTSIPEFVKTAPPAPKKMGDVAPAGTKPPRAKAAGEKPSGSNKIILIVVIVAVLFMFALGGILYYFLFAVRADLQPVEETITDQVITVDEQKEELYQPMVLRGSGNTAGNIINGGLVAESEGWHYFHSNLGGSLHRINLASGEVEAISADSAWFINVSGQWVFYSNRDDNNRVYRVMDDGSNRMALSISSAWFLTLVDDNLYFINEDDNYRLYHLDPEDGVETRIGEDSAWFMAIDQDWIYYVNRDDEETVYRIRTDGSDREKINSEPSCCLNLVDDTLFFVNQASGSRLQSMVMEGETENILTDQPVWFVNVDGDRIFYADETDNFAIYTMLSDGSEKENITSDPARYVLVAGDWLYYLNHAESDTVYKIKIDGTGRRLAEDPF